MNILEIYVTNISDIGEKDQYGFCLRRRIMLQ